MLLAEACAPDFTGLEQALGGIGECLAGNCSQGSGWEPGVTSRISVEIGRDTLAVGDTVRAVARFVAANGSEVPDVTFAWTSTDSSVAAVDSTGLVRAQAPGATWIAAASGGVAGGRTVRVITPAGAAAAAPR